MIENELHIKSTILNGKLKGEKELKYDPTFEQPVDLEHSLEEERLNKEEREIERKEKEKEERLKKLEEEKGKNKKPVGIFTLLYSESTCKERLIMIVALFGSMGAGCALLLFAILFRGAINNIGPRNNFAEIFATMMSDLCLKFLYVAIGVWCAGTLMIWLWTLAGRVTTTKN
jgi:hypothetical protein